MASACELRSAHIGLEERRSVRSDDDKELFALFFSCILFSCILSLQISLAAAVAVARGFDENDSRFDQMVFMLLPVIADRGGQICGRDYCIEIIRKIHLQWYRRQNSSNDVSWPIVGQKL